MRRELFRELAGVTVFLILGTVVIAVSGADLALSSRFCEAGKWPTGNLLPWQMLYRLDRIPAIALALIGLMAYIISLIRVEASHWKRSGIFLVLLLALGPGLLVNALFKDHWGRPRPREVQQFGGNKQFLHPWQKGRDGNGRSFPSGHAAAAFYMAAPYFIYRRANRRFAHVWLIGGIAFGLLMSAARITQGAHFLSDNLWAWGMVQLTAVCLYYLLGLDQEVAAPSPAEPR